jgi:hypothetical protein
MLAKMNLENADLTPEEAKQLEDVDSQVNFPLL